jgi:glutamine synthetase
MGNCLSAWREEAMRRERLVMFCYCDIAGQVRGKGFPASQLPKRLRTGIGWTPTNIMLTAFGPIADSRWGPFGDLQLMPDPATEVDIDFGETHPREHFFLGDVLHTDGQPWDCCPRTFLKGALDALEQRAGLRLLSAFEQEFYYEGAEDRLGSAYNLDAMRRHGTFGELLISALQKAGVEPECYLPEYGPRQYEVTYAPAIGVPSADRAVIVRELAKAVARVCGAFGELLARGHAGRRRQRRPRPYEPARSRRARGDVRRRRPPWPERGGRPLRRRHPASCAGALRRDRPQCHLLSAAGATPLERRVDQRRIP